MNFAIKAGAYFIGASIGTFVGLAIAIPSMLYYGWAFWLSWNWVIPHALGLPIISFWQAVALTSIMWFTTHEARVKKKTDDEDIKVVQTLLNVLMRPVGVLAICWVCKEYLI